MQHITHNILNAYLSLFNFISDNDVDCNALSGDLDKALVYIYKNADNSFDELNCPPGLYKFQTTSKHLNKYTELAINHLGESISLKLLNIPINYLLDELTCNILQHSNAKKSFIFTNFNSNTKTIDICVADNGLTIFGSYVNKQKYIDKLNNSNINAILLAKDGYSTKDLPEAENRGYGISSNINMVTNGLCGAFSILSGDALYYCENNYSKIFSLPNNIEWNGTLFVVSIPINIPSDFDFYKYIK
ncbi:MAG: hypothetical protein MJ003_06685 [Paludibacteraceae bacterium]|nr:hypothetical protein [Paludibacteraceae bacterium]